MRHVRPKLSGFSRAVGLLRRVVSPIRTRRESAAAIRGAVCRRSAEAIVEPIEFRRLLSATLFGITGADTANEAQNYTLNLSGVGPGASSVDHWSINWGDGGAAQTVSGFPSSVTHAYPDGPAGLTITADVVTADGTVFHARNGPPTNAADLDTTFGTGGTTTAPDANAAALGIQSDGKLLVAGSAQNSTGGYDFTVTRYNADGTLDTAFGAGGATTIPFFDNIYRQDAHADALLVLPSGKILVGGTANYAYPDPSPGSAMALAQLNSDGSIDTTYGNNGTGTQELWIGQVYGFYSHNITGLALQPDGKVVAGGWERSDTFYGSSYRFALARFNADGTPDLGFGGFGSGGYVTQDAYGNAENIARTIALQPDGKIVLAGSGNSHMQVMRFTSNGLPDPTFGSAGDYLDPTGSAGYALAVQPDGKIVLAGDDHSDGNTWVRLIRLSADGAPDSGFGSGGQVLTWLGLNTRGAFGLSVAADGKLLVAAGGNPTMYSHDFTLLQYNAAGAPDPNFGAGGQTTVDGGSDDVGVGMGLAPDGKIVVLGTAGFGDPQRGIGPADAELARFQGVPPPKTVQVLNVAPAPSIGGLPAGGGSEGVPVTLSASAADAPIDQAAGFGYAWTVTKNGAAFAAGAGAGITFTPDDNGSYTVTLNATDRDGAIGTTQQTLNVANVAPGIALAGVPAGDVMGEGTTATLTASATDVAIDQAAGFTFSWSILKNGLPYGSGAGAAYAFLPDDEGMYDISCTVTDKDGGAATATQRITATNTSPSVTIGVPPPAVRGQSVTLTGSFTDPGVLDTHTAHWDFGDGTPAVDVANADAGLAVTHVYAGAGTYTATLTVTDNGGGATTVTRPVTIDVADLQVNPNDPTKTDLVIGGTDGNDAIAVTGGSGPMQVTVNGSAFGTFNPTGRIVVSGYDGNDDLEVVDAAITLPAYLDGGAGDDKLVGGGGADTFFGGAGYDEANFYNHAGGVLVTMDGQANDGANGGAEHDNVGSDIEIVAATAYDDYLDASMLTTRIVMNGYGGNNILIGGSGNDSLYGDGGSSKYYAGAGNDEVFGGSGDDTAYGGDGNDVLFGYGGNDSITGDAGDDLVYGGDGNDTLYGGLGADQLYGESGDDTVFGESIDATGDGAGDYFSGGAGTDNFGYTTRTVPVAISNDGVANDGQAGENDNVASDFERLYGGSGNDALTGSGNADGLYGNGGNDTLVGNDGNDDLQGGDGNDVIYGGGGNDLIQGQAGDDSATGDAGDDYVYGGDGNDTLYDGAGSDHVYGENGDDTVYAADASGQADGNGDVFSGGAGTNNFGYITRTVAVAISNDGVANDGQVGENDNVGTDFQRLYGGSGNDAITGANNADGLYGNGGSDTINGNGGNDEISGGDGNDSITGGSGADALYGDAGNDTLYARDGLDDARIDGGSGTNAAQMDALPKDSNRFSIQTPLA